MESAPDQDTPVASEHDEVAATRRLPPWWRSLLLRVLRSVLVCYLAICLLVWFFQGHLLFQPSRAIAVNPGTRHIPYEAVTPVAEDGTRLGAWWVPGEADKPVVLFCHGNAGNIGDRLFVVELLHQQGYGLLLFDYRGYGASEGTPDEDGTYQDAMAVWRYLTNTRGVDPGDIIIWGRSLGGGVATWLASQVEARGLLLDSTFTSMHDRAGEIYWFLPVSLLCRYRYDNRARLPSITMPIAIVHGRPDEIIPVHHAQDLLAVATAPCQLFLTDGTHNGGLMTESATYLRVLDLLAGGHLTDQEIVGVPLDRRKVLAK